MLSERGQLISIWSGLVLATIFGFSFYFLVGFFPPPSATLTPDEVAALYLNNPLKLQIGIVLCIITAGFPLPWAIIMSLQMARLEKGVPVWAITQLAGGSLGAFLFILWPIFWAVAAFSAERTPEITTIMHEAAFLCVVAPVTFFMFQMVPIAIVCFTQRQDVQHSAFPRWVGYFSIWMLLVGECGVLAVMFKTGPFAWNGLIVFWLPFIVFGIYFAATNLCMIKALKRQLADAMAV